ncbi:TonB-dependent receptor [Brevundimonas naejangsanensis]|uniref:TonB-dependent receptor n=1 Tax=Brevundimonas naejangsanensis TaxID=588932 RepID=A0A172Y6N4_9CAUL|nr:TonB-dependent receptor [Brevundimonas naejangsanensis]ANF54884.1 TonB-dependent receptor [Brevundimonas naejangsanensis]
MSPTLNARLMRSTGLGASLMMAVAVSATAAAAQTEPPASPESSTQLDEIIVTGSRIARKDYNSTSPIVTVGKEDFQATGSVTIDSLITDLPQFVPSVNSTSNNPSNGGQANIDLRGLGTQRTLVLMNGRRVIPSNPNGTVDINILPTPLIRSVEVISGGASATYGSDALAGVANFIIDDRFDGVQIDAQYGVTDRGDGETESYSVTVGGDIDGDRGNAVLSASRSTRQLIYNANRDFSAISGPSGTSPLGSTVFDANNLPNQTAINTYFGRAGIAATGGFGFNNDGSLFAYQGTRNYKSPGGIDFDGYANPGSDYAYNTGALNYLQLPLERWNLFSALNYRISDAVKVYGSLLLTDYQSANELAASPAASSTGFRVPVTNPFIPADLAALLATRANRGASFRLDKRFNDLGGRRAAEDYTVYQGTFGVRGDLVGLQDWTYDVYGQYGRSERTTTQSGNVSRSAVQALLDAADGGASLCTGGFDPFGQSNLSPACIAYIGRTTVNNTVQEQTVLEASLQGGLFNLPAGEVRFASGLQYRGDNFDFRPDASLARINPVVTRPDGGTTGGSEIAGFNPQQPLTGTTYSVEAFIEAIVPILRDLPFVKSLELNLGYRYADYDTVGGAPSYKAEVNWIVSDALRLRGGIQHAVRAPSIGELFQPLNTNFPSIGGVSATGLGGDPCDTRSSYRTGPNAAKVAALCSAQAAAAGSPNFIYTNNQVPGFAGGNPDLTEEVADSFTAGLVVTSPFRSAWTSGLSASLDYYSIEIEDVIGAVSASAMLQGCFNAQGQNPTYDQSNGYCQLFRRDPLSGSVIDARELNENLATLKTSGVDAQIDWRINLAEVGLPAWGDLNLNVIVGWLGTRERQDVPGGPEVDRVGTVDVVTAGQFNSFPEWKSLTSLNWSHGDFGLGLRWRYVDEMTAFTSGEVLNGTHYFDLNAQWSITDALTLRATVNNVADEQPQTWNPGAQANTDPSTYDVLGRRFSVGLSAKF